MHMLISALTKHLNTCPLTSLNAATYAASAREPAGAAIESNRESRGMDGDGDDDDDDSDDDKDDDDDEDDDDDDEDDEDKEAEEDVDVDEDA